MHFGPIFRSMLHNKTKVSLLVLEIAFTVAIVLNCLNLILDQKERLSRPSGLVEEHLLAVDTKNWGGLYKERERRIQQMKTDLEALRGLPGVVDVTPITVFPLIGGGSAFLLRDAEAPEAELVRSPIYSVDPHFLSTMGLELIEGRGFTDEDLPVEAGSRVANVIITKDLADALFPDGDAIGKRVFSGQEEFLDIIVGVVEHMYTPYGGGAMETRITFVPNLPAFERGSRFLIRTEDGMKDEVFGGIEETLISRQDERMVSVQTLLEVKQGGFLINYFLINALSIIVVLLLFVTGLGIFGMTSFSVTQRTKQVGTRRALGATRSAIVSYFLVENTLITSLGLGLGLLGAFALNVTLVSHLDGKPLGLGLIFAGTLLLWAVSLLATVAPARKASVLAPALATRSV